MATRHMLLKQQDHEVTSALGFTEAIAMCERAGFDLFILGHSIPMNDKLALIGRFKEHCPAPILSLDRAGEPAVDADYHATPDNPERLLQVVSSILEDAPPAGAASKGEEVPRRPP